MKHPNPDKQRIIEKVNEKSPYDQGIFFQPYGVPVHIKEHVIYSRYDSSGTSGGTCWGDEAHYYENEPPKDHLTSLDLYLNEVYPDLTFMQYRLLINRIEKIKHNNSETEYEYYGNSTCYHIDYIVLSELDELIEKFKEEN